MLRPNICRPDGRLVKLLLFSKLLDKSPRTFIYFTTFEKKRRVRSPLPHTTKLFGFWYFLQSRILHATCHKCRLILSEN